MASNLSPSKQYKAMGGRALVDVARVAEIRIDTLRKYHKRKPKLFHIICLGALQELQSQGKTD